MAQPPSYTRQYNFNDFQTTSPANPLPGVQVDNELNSAKANLDGLNTNIAKIQRDDGLLANQSVHKNALDNDVLALIGLSGFTVDGDWSASRSYTAGTLVNFNDATYLATVAHTSGTVFSTDKNAGKWILLANAAIDTSASAVDKFEGTGSQTAFTLSFTYTSNTDVLVFVNGALRNPGDDYSISGNTITFSTAPSTPSVSGNENVIIWGPSVTTIAAKTAAETASGNASGFATAASNSAAAALTSQNAAAASAATATTQASISTTQAGNSATSAASALSSQNAAAASESASSTSETNAAASAATATTQAGLATTNGAAQVALATTQAGLATSNGAAQVALATTQAGNAASSASAASTSETNSANSASAASTSETNAAASAATATTQAGLATTNGAAQVALATTQANNAAASLATFQGQYHGAANSDPTSGLDAGDLYFNNTSGLRVYNGTAWEDIKPTSSEQTNINAVAGKATEIGLLGVSGVISNMGVLGTTDAVSDMNSLAAISSDITSLAGALEKTYTVTVANVGGSNVFVLDGVNYPSISLFRGNTYIFDQSDSSNSGHPLAIKDSGGSSYTDGVTATGTPGQSGAKTTFEVPSTAPSSLRYYCTVHGNGMGNTIAVTDSNISLVATNIANVNLTGGSITNVNNVGGSIANVNTVATNLSSINDFADKYRIGSSDPSSSNDEGDLFYNTTSNTLKVYNGSAWEGGVTAGSGFLALTGGQLTGNLTFSGSQTVDGRDVSADGAKLDGIEASATADQTASEIRALVESASDSNVFTDADHTKLNAIEASATADQTAAEIRTLVESATDSNVFTDADHTKLNGIAASATNVTNTNQLTNGAGFVTSSGVTSVATGGGLTGGTVTSTGTISHADTSSQSSSNNSGRTYIQDITLDTYGHVTGIATATETVVNTDTNTTYSANSNFGTGLSGTEIRLNNDRRRNASGENVYSGNSHDFTFYDSAVGIRWYTEGAEEMRLQNNGTLHVDGDIIAYSSTVSDRRLKTEIARVENGLDKLSALNGYTFKYINGDLPSAGVMADEVKLVLPSAVKTAQIPLHTDDPEDFDIVHYDQLCAIFIEAIKELKARVEALENGG